MHVYEEDILFHCYLCIAYPVALCYNQHSLSLTPRRALILPSTVCSLHHHLPQLIMVHGISQVWLHLERCWDLTGVTSPGETANPQRRVLTSSLILQRRKLIIIESKHSISSSAFLFGHCILRWSAGRESRTNHSLSLPLSSLCSSLFPPAPSFTQYVCQREREPWRVVGLGSPYCSTIYFLIIFPAAESLYFPERQKLSYWTKTI